jgi:2-dehydropantoate 2-reductase
MTLSFFYLTIYPVFCYNKINFNEYILSASLVTVKEGISMEIKNVSLIGLGAVGAIAAVAAYNALGRQNLQIIASGQRAERLKKQDLMINGKSYHFNIVSPEEKTSPSDLVIVAVKDYSLQEAIKDIKNHVDERTVIIALMNGITSEEKLGTVYGMEKLLYSTVTISSQRSSKGVRFSTRTGGINIGEKDGNTQTERLLAVQSLFKKGGIPCMISSTIIRDLWVKLLINASGNTVQVLLRGPHEYFQKIEEANSAMTLIMREVVAVSKAAGTGLTEEDITKLYRYRDNYPPENYSSMAQDLLAGRHMEIDALLGVILDLGRHYGIPTPVCEFTYDLLHTLNAVNAGALEK